MSSAQLHKSANFQVILPIVSFLMAFGPQQLILIYLGIQPLLGFTKHEELDLVKHLFNRMFVLSLLVYTLLTISHAHGRITFRSTGMEKYLLLYFAGVFISVIAALSFGDTVASRSLTSLATVPILISLVYIVGYWFDTIDAVKTALRYFIISACLVSVYGVGEFFVLGMTEGFGTERVRSIFSDPNIFARYILLGIFFIVPFLFYKDYSLFRRKTLQLFLGLLLVNLLFSLSRSGYLALIVGGIVFSLFIDSKKVKSVIISGSVLVGLLIFAYLLTQRSFTGSAIIEPSNINRFLLILGGIDMIQSNWFIGVGYTNFANYYERHYLENYLSLSSESYKFSGFATEIHNWFIEVWAEQGIIGLIIFIIFFSRLFLLLYRAIANEQIGSMRNILLGFFMAIFVFLFQGFFYHTFISQFFFWLIAGFAVAALQIAVRNQKSLMQRSI
jgi:teichuronic acid biosynthesis protein TuaE